MSDLTSKPAETAPRDQVKREFRVGILQSIIGGAIFVYLLNPLVLLLGRAALRGTGPIPQAYQNRIFREIATGRPDFAYFGLVFFLGLFIVVVVTLEIRRFMNLKRPITPPPYDPAAGVKSKRLDVPYLILLALLFLATLGGLVEWNLRLRIATSFEQHVTILAPHLTDQTQKEIRARFASLRNFADYVALHQNLERLATQYHVVLPENQLYSVFPVNSATERN